MKIVPCKVSANSEMRKQRYKSPNISISSVLLSQQRRNRIKYSVNRLDVFNFYIELSFIDHCSKLHGFHIVNSYQEISNVISHISVDLQPTCLPFATSLTRG